MTARKGKQAEHVFEPCPNPECGGTDVHLGQSDRRVFVRCTTCGLRGPGAIMVNHVSGPFEDRRAVSLWNRLPRTPLSPTNAAVTVDNLIALAKAGGDPKLLELQRGVIVKLLAGDRS